MGKVTRRMHGAFSPSRGPVRLNSAGEKLSAGENLGRAGSLVIRARPFLLSEIFQLLQVHNRNKIHGMYKIKQTPLNILRGTLISFLNLDNKIFEIIRQFTGNSS